MPDARDAEIEAAVDRAVMRRLATDQRYRNAEDAEAQAQREQEITDEEYERIRRRALSPYERAMQEEHDR